MTINADNLTIYNYKGSEKAMNPLRSQPPVTCEKCLIRLTFALNDFSGWKAPPKLPVASRDKALHPGKAALTFTHPIKVSKRSKVPADTNANLAGLSPDGTEQAFQHSSTQIPYHTRRQRAVRKGFFFLTLLKLAKMS